MKSVAVKHPKTAFDFLKPIEQSYYSWPRNCQKKRHFWHRISYHRTSKNLWQIIKIDKEIKDYYSTTKQHKFMQSKAADCMLKLDIRYFS